MINISQTLNTINSLPQDNTLYLLEKLPCGTGIFASNGNILYIVPNNELCDSLGIRTDFLHLETNVFVTAFNTSVSSFENGYYNYVELQLSNIPNIEENVNAFVNLCLAHASYMNGQEFVAFFDSLVSLFQLPREQHYKNLIGLMGELLFIEHIFSEYELDISSYWHTEGSSSQLDFVSPTVNFEVKTTSSVSLRFTIKHNQLFGNHEQTYLVAVSLEESNAGRSLESVISSLQENPGCCNSMQFSVNIEREKRRISPHDLRSKKFILKRICAYSAASINPFSSIPDCVEDMSYKLDLLPFQDVAFSDIVKTLRLNK